MENPFRYGLVVTGRQFYDRAEIRRQLVDTVSGGANVVLYGPRRYGKSSLVLNAISDLTAVQIPCVYFDMMKIGSVDEFARAYAKAVYAVCAPASGGLHEIAAFFKHLRPVLGLGEDGKPELQLSEVSIPTTAAALSDVFDLPERLAHGRRLIVVFDEFQEIDDFPASLRFEKIMRSCIQRHVHVNYIFLGSRTHLLRRMFTAKVRPFYNSASTFSLGKPPVSDSVKFLIERFASGGVTLPKPVAERMVTLADNLPFYIQALGFETFVDAMAHRRRELAQSDVEAAFDRMGAAKRDLYEQLFQRLSIGQKVLIQALAAEPAVRFDTDYRARHHLGTSSSVNSALRKLSEEGHVELSDNRHACADPLFARFLREAPQIAFPAR